MDELILLAAITVVFITVIYLSGRKKDGFVKHFSRGAFMRELNEKMEADIENKSPDGTV
jgi:hypothetical protein